MKIIVAIPLMLCLFGMALGADYCDPQLCDDEQTHVACGNDGSFSDRCSNGARLLDIDETAQDALVAAHNGVRQKWASGKGKVKVKACRMATVSWDDELAKLAEYNVKQCQMEHDDCHNTLIYKSSGQNLFYTAYKGGSSPDLISILKQAVDDWASEGSSTNAGILKQYPENYQGPAIGHFTMVAQELNVAVGCAVSNYVDNGYNTFLVACNYATTNFIGKPVYRACKKAAKECNSGTNPDYPALCSSNENVKFN